MFIGLFVFVFDLFVCFWFCFFFGRGGEGKFSKDKLVGVSL